MEHTSSITENTSSDKRIKYLKPICIQLTIESAIIANSYDNTTDDLSIISDIENGVYESR